MATNTGTLSLTRPRDPRRLYAAKFWQYNVGLLLAATGAMLLMVFFVISAIVSGWVSDQDPAQLGRILAYDSWLFPFATASVGLIKVGMGRLLAFLRLPNDEREHHEVNDAPNDALRTDGLRGALDDIEPAQLVVPGLLTPVEQNPNVVQREEAQ